MYDLLRRTTLNILIEVERIINNLSFSSLTHNIYRHFYYDLPKWRCHTKANFLMEKYPQASKQKKEKHFFSMNCWWWFAAIPSMRDGLERGNQEKIIIHYGTQLMPSVVFLPQNWWHGHVCLQKWIFCCFMNWDSLQSARCHHL
jgi:hypothetical protein